MTQHPLDIPDVSAILDPAPHDPPAGDWRDDDGAALDSYFEAMPLGPLTSVLVQALKDGISFAPEKSSRIVSAEFFVDDCSLIGFPYPALMVMPADPNRTALIIQGSHNAGLAALYWHSEAFTAQGTIDAHPRTNASFLPPAQTSGGSQLVLDHYTGPIWCAPANATAVKCSYKITAVTA